MDKLNNRLRLARENAGLSQGQVARILDLHRPTISEIEAGRRRVTAEELARFAQAYDVSVDWLTDTRTNSEFDHRIELAARELAKLKPKDLDRVLEVLRQLRSEKGSKR
jgi:transcriptional regulator with XRE-family HTH domain